jgi:hypothetical protein
LADAAIDASARAGYDHFNLLIANWRRELVRWRCGLSLGDVFRLRVHTRGWSCADLHMFVGELTFADAGPERQELLDRVPTRFSLPTETVDFIIESGRIAVRNEAATSQFLNSLQNRNVPTAAR